MTIAAIITVVVQFLFYFNFFWSIFKGKKASDNPWEATTLEWTIPSPPPHDNFAGVMPTVYRGPYEFSVPGAPKDYRDADRAGRRRGAGRFRRNKREWRQRSQTLIRVVDVGVGGGPKPRGGNGFRKNGGDQRRRSTFDFRRRVIASVFGWRSPAS